MASGWRNTDEIVSAGGGDSQNICRLLHPADHTLILLHVAEPALSIVGALPCPVAATWTASRYTRERDLHYAAHLIYASQVEQSERTEIEIELLADQQRLAAASYSVGVLVRFGNPADEIVNAVEQEAIDMVAMATHGRTGLRQLVLGSVTEQVLRHLKIPVLLMRPFDQQADGI
jgi:nucleotide-binding universal stress UspA family protein